MTEFLKLTKEEIEAGRSDKGGFTKAALAAWGVPWPPPAGWKEALLEGRSPGRTDEFAPSPIRPEMSAHDLLQTVVLAVIEAGHAECLHKFPDVLEYFGAQMPDTPPTQPDQEDLF